MNLNDCGLTWSDIKTIETREGAKLLKTASPNEKFWDLYRERKKELFSCGVTWSEFKGTKTVNWWSTNGKFLDLAEIELTEVSKTEWAKFMNQYEHFGVSRGDNTYWELLYYHLKEYDRNGEPVLGELLSKNTYLTIKISKYFVNKNTTAPKNQLIPSPI